MNPVKTPLNIFNKNKITIHLDEARSNFLRNCIQ